MLGTTSSLLLKKKTSMQWVTCAKQGVNGGSSTTHQQVGLTSSWKNNSRGITLAHAVPCMPYAPKSPHEHAINARTCLRHRIGAPTVNRVLVAGISRVSLLPCADAQRIAVHLVHPVMSTHVFANGVPMYCSNQDIIMGTHDEST